MAAPTIPAVNLKPRVAESLGSISALNTPVQFGSPDITSVYRGVVTITAAGGAVTGPTWILQASIDNGLTWFVIPAQTTLPITPTGVVTGSTAVLAALQYNISGLGGMLFEFALTAGTGITATTIWATVG